MNSVAPIASNRVYVREKYFNCSTFICKERSQWRLQSRRSTFFPVFVCFVCCCCCCCFLLIIIIFPWLVSFYCHCWPFTPREIFIYIDYLEIPSWNFGFFSSATKWTKFRKVFLIERFQQEGGVRVCGIALLGYFWCGIAVIFIWKYGIAVFRV